MKNGNYDFEYHSLAEDADELYEDECYYNDGTDEPWIGLDQDENEVTDEVGWENYYHNITDELDDE